MTATENKGLLQHAFTEVAKGNSRPFIGSTAWSRTYANTQLIASALPAPDKYYRAGCRERRFQGVE